MPKILSFLSLLIFVTLPQLSWGQCADADVKVSRPDAADPSSWNALDQNGNAVTDLLVWHWVEEGGVPIRAEVSLAGAAVGSESSGGTPLDLSEFYGSGKTVDVKAQARSATAGDSGVASLSHTFCSPVVPPVAPILSK